MYYIGFPFEESRREPLQWVLWAVIMSEAEQDAQMQAGFLPGEAA